MQNQERTTLKQHHARLSSPLFESTLELHQPLEVIQELSPSPLPTNKPLNQHKVDQERKKAIHIVRANTIVSGQTDGRVKQEDIGNKIIEKLWNIQAHPEILQMNYYKRLLDLNQALAQSQSHWQQVYNSKFEEGKDRRKTLNIEKLALGTKSIQIINNTHRDSKILSTQLKKQLEILQEQTLSQKNLHNRIPPDDQSDILKSVKFNKNDFKTEMNKYKVQKKRDFKKQQFLNRKLSAKEITLNQNFRKDKKEKIRIALSISKRSYRSEKSIEKKLLPPFTAELQFKILPSKLVKALSNYLQTQEKKIQKIASKSLKIDKSKVHRNLVHKIRLFQKHDEKKIKLKSITTCIENTFQYKNQLKPIDLKEEYKNRHSLEPLPTNLRFLKRAPSEAVYSALKERNHSPNTPIVVDDRWMFDFQRRVKDQKIKEQRRLQKIAAKAQNEIQKYQFFQKPKEYHVNLSLKLKQNIKSDLQLSRSLQKIKQLKIKNAPTQHPKLQIKNKEKKVIDNIKNNEKKRLILSPRQKQNKENLIQVVGAGH